MKKIIIIIISYLSCIIILSFFDIKYELGLSWWMYFMFGGLLLIVLFIIMDMIPINKIKTMFYFRPSKQKIIRELAI